METIRHFSDLLNITGVPNLLTIGIAILLVWLLISGIRKGLKKTGHDKDTQGEQE
jgi:hypothetical protein